MRTPASPKQQALFFALAHDLGDDAKMVKRRAKHHVGVASFNDLTTDQLSELIDRLLVVQTSRQHASASDHAHQT